jgi:hypothetical protein
MLPTNSPNFYIADRREGEHIVGTHRNADCLLKKHVQFELSNCIDWIFLLLYGH